MNGSIDGIFVRGLKMFGGRQSFCLGLAFWSFGIFWFTTTALTHLILINPKIHQVITPDGVLINDAGDIADEDGYVYASKWRDPRTNKILT